MAIDFYASTDRAFEHRLFALETCDFDAMEEANRAFEAKTGIFLDPYGRVKLSAPHCQLWGELIGAFVTTNGRAVVPHLSRLRKFLSERAADGIGLTLVGD